MKKLTFTSGFLLSFFFVLTAQAKLCMHAGFIYQVDDKGNCPRPPTCASGGFQCNPAMYGDNLCTDKASPVGSTTDCENKTRAMSSEAQKQSFAQAVEHLKQMDEESFIEFKLNSKTYFEQERHL